MVIKPAAESDAAGYEPQHLSLILVGLPTLIATGFRDLDAKLDGGMNAGELIVMAGRPSIVNYIGLMSGGGGESRTQLSSTRRSRHECPRDGRSRKIYARGRLPTCNSRTPDIVNSAWR